VKYAVRMGFGAKFHRHGFRHPKADGEDTKTHSHHGDRISIFLFINCGTHSSENGNKGTQHRTVSAP
jgi:hypothetical protein